MEEDPEDGLRILARLSSSTKSSKTSSSSKQSSSSKTFFVWGTGNEILVRNERVLGHDGNDDLDDDKMMHKDEESVDDCADDDSDIKTKSISWSHLSSKTSKRSRSLNLW